MFVIKNNPTNLIVPPYTHMQHRNLESEKFHVLKVDENYVQMSSFIMKNLKTESFENG